MPTVLTITAGLKCGHPTGILTPVSTAKLTVSKQPVLVKANVAAQSIVGCVNDSTSTTHCKTVATVTVGEALKLSVGGVKVLLDTLKAMTDGVPPAVLLIPPSQAKLQAK